jgi:ribosomal-protein-alanine N-acetyltransferase
MMREDLLHVSTELTTPRLRLRRFREGDGELVFQLIDKERARLEPSFPVSVAFVTSPGRGELFVRRKLTEWYLGSSYSFAVFLQDNDEYIGYLAIKGLDWTVPKADMGYYLASLYDRQGLMSEAVTAALRFAFTEVMLRRVFVRISPENLASLKLAEKCGFVREGLLRCDFSPGGRPPQDMVYCGINFSDWRRQQSLTAIPPELWSALVEDRASMEIEPD